MFFTYRINLSFKFMRNIHEYFTGNSGIIRILKCLEYHFLARVSTPVLFSIFLDFDNISSTEYDHTRSNARAASLKSLSHV